MTARPEERPLWTPDPDFARTTQMAAFHRLASERHAVGPSAHELWRWSVEHPEPFWNAVWDFCGVIGERGERAVVDGDRLPGARWYPEARLNYAENLLRRRDDAPALIFRAEDRIRRQLTWAELHESVSRLAQALAALGVGPGDRVAGYVPNMPEAIVYMLAAASLGAVISTASPDFGAGGVVDRFGQIEPRVLLAADGYFYNGRTHSCLERLPDIVRRLPSLKRTIIVPHAAGDPDISRVPGAVRLDEFVSPFRPGEIEFRRLPFDHPLYILFSSGTTGAPKCIVHTAGGVLLTHLKEHRLHADIRAGDRAFYFTTCGWMMWNWLSSALASEATVALFDGSPFHPGPEALFDYADDAGMTQLGVSAKFIDAIRKAGLRPRETHDLSSVRTTLSTGSPLAPEGFDYVYRDVKPDVHLASISGGTDLCAGFVVGNPTLPVWRGEIQGPALGMDVDVWDERGRSLPAGKGELVCTSAFPSVPAGFWGDEDGSRFRAAYFDTWPNVWRHGDWMEWTARGGAVIHGRSDATLNAGGVRIGTAEIYRLVDRLPEVTESIVIGQPWENDTRVVLFVRLADGARLGEGLRERIRETIRREASPRHVPARIVEVPDIPRTKSGKISELAVRAVVMGEAVENADALANPEALDEYRNRPELQS